MRQESAKIARAFLAKRQAKAARTHTDGHALYLHGNRIAWRNADGSVSLTLAGWGTPTTRDRLNTICDLAWGYRPYNQRDFVQYWHDTPIDADQIITVHSLAVREAA